MTDPEKVIKQIKHCVMDQCCGECEYKAHMACKHFLLEKALVLLKQQAELLKEHDEQVKQWAKEIAENQLAHVPKDSHEFMSLDEHLENEYKRGIWDGLQMAFEILTEGR